MANAFLVTILVLMINIFLFHGDSQAAAQPPSTHVDRRKFISRSVFYRAEHDEARRAVGVDPLMWSDTLANAASRAVTYKKTKEGCHWPFANMTAGSNPHWFVENRKGLPVPPQSAVGSWVAEKKYYNYENNSCTNNHVCGGYTQVEWRKSMAVGCAGDTCVDGDVKVSLTVCFYNPPGNVIGKKPC